MSLDRRLSVLPSVMISVRELGTPTPMVKLLLNAPATFIESIPGKAHDMEGIHDRSRAGEFFGGCAFEPGESIHRDDLNALAPSVRLGGQPGFKDPRGRAWPARIRSMTASSSLIGSPRLRARFRSFLN